MKQKELEKPLYHNQIITILWENPLLLHEFINKNLRYLSPGDIATIFFTAAKQNYKLDSSDIYKLAKYLDSKTTFIRPLTLANIMNGLRIHTCKDPSIIYLLEVLKTKLDTLELDFPPHFIALSLTGFKQMTNNNHTLSLIESLTAKIQQSPNYAIPPNEFGNTLIGLNNFSSDDSRILSLLESLQYILEQYSPSSSTKQMTARSMSASLYSLKGMSWKHEIVRNLYQILLPHMINCKEPFSSIELGSSFYGLQKFDVSNQLCCDILTILNEKLCQFNGVVDSQTIGSIFYGLNNLPSYSPLVRVILKNLTNILKKFPKNELITCHSYSSAIYGFRNMSNSFQEVSELLDIFVDLFDQCIQKHERYASIMLIGLRKMSSTQYSIQKLLYFIYNMYISSLTSTSLENLPSKLPRATQSYESYLEYCEKELLNKKDNYQKNNEIKKELENNIDLQYNTVEEIIPTSRILLNDSFRQTFQLTSSVLCKSIHSFQAMSSDQIIVLHLLYYLTYRLRQSNDILLSKDAGILIYGLQSMNPCNHYIRDVLLCISEIIDDEKRFPEKYIKPLDYKSILVGLNGLRKQGINYQQQHGECNLIELERLENVISKKSKLYN